MVVGNVELKRFREAVKPIEDALFLPDGEGEIHKQLLQKQEEK